MDDGPEVGALDMLKNLERSFPIKYFYAYRRNENETPDNCTFLSFPSLANFAIEKSESDFLVRADAEMILIPTTLQQYYDAMKDAEVKKLKKYFMTSIYTTSEESMPFINANWKNLPKIIDHCRKKFRPARGFITTMGISKAYFYDIGRFKENLIGWGGVDQQFFVDATAKNYEDEILEMTLIHQYHKRNSEYEIGGPSYPITNSEYTLLAPNTQ